MHERRAIALVATTLRTVRKAAGLALLVVAIGGTARAVDIDVPEIDPGSMAGALTLLSGGVMLLTGRVRRK